MTNDVKRDGTMRATSIDDLYRLKEARYLDSVVVESGAIKRAGVLRYALKYALWAVRPGGVIEIIDDGPRNYDVTPYQMPFSLVAQQAFKLFARDAECLDIDQAGMRLRFRRTKSEGARDWTAGIVFSGNPGEVSAVHACLDALFLQRELAPGGGGDVIVAGPAAARGVLDKHPHARYLAFENAEGPRAFTAAKKNAIIAASCNSNVAIMHARILLEPGCLTRIGEEFDLITPRVTYREGEIDLPYIDWLTIPTLCGDQIPTKLSSGILYRRERYLDELRRGGMPYIDGGLFMGRRALLLDVPLNDDLAWGEAEDVEWCSRLYTAGCLIDLQPGATARSQTYKLGGFLRRNPRVAQATAPMRRRLKEVLSNGRQGISRLAGF